MTKTASNALHESCDSHFPFQLVQFLGKLLVGEDQFIAENPS